MSTSTSTSTPTAAPVVEYQRADASKLGAAVAKEITKSLAPYLVVAALVLAAVLYLVLR